MKNLLDLEDLTIHDVHPFGHEQNTEQSESSAERRCFLEVGTAQRTGIVRAMVVRCLLKLHGC